MLTLEAAAPAADTGKAIIDWSSLWTAIASKFISIAGRLLLCAVILVAGYFIVKLVTKKILASPKMEKLDPGVRSFLRTFIKVVLNAVIIISVVGILGIPMASVITVLGAAGAAIALALQGTLGNLASGIMIVAKNDEAHVSLSKQIQDKTAQRTYLCIVRGNVKTDRGVIETRMDRDKNDRKRMAVVTEGGREAVTEYKVLERFGRFTVVRCRLKTGRTHQIRLHMEYLGYPVVGDAKYSPMKTPFF